MKTISKTNPRAVLYTRVSSPGQAEKGTSLDEQLKAGIIKAEAMGAKVVGHEEDAGVSGALYASRPGINRALEIIEQGEGDLLIIANFDRFSRDREHQSAIKRRVENAGGRLVFCDMDFDDTPEGDLMFGIVGGFAEYERKRIRARTIKGRRARAEAGIQPARSVSPYGYHIPTFADLIRGEYAAEALGTYQVVEERAVFIREAFQRVASGDSLRSVCKYLNDAGAPRSQGGKEWYASVLREIIQNPVYKGMAAYGREQTFTDEKRKTELGFKLATYSRPRDADEWLTLSAPALVSEVLWDTAQTWLAVNKNRLSGNPKRRCLLSGLVLCPVCGRKMVGHNSGKQKYYQCPTAKAVSQIAPRECTAGGIVQDDLNGLVIEAFLQVAAQPAQVAAAVEAWRNRAVPAVSTEAERVRLAEEVSTLDRRERAIIQAQIAGIGAGASANLYDDEFAKIRKRRDEITKRQKEILPAKSTSEPQPQKAADVVCHALQMLSEVLTAPEVSDAERHDLLSRVVESVVADTTFGRKGLKAVTVNITPHTGNLEGETVRRIEMQKRGR